MKSILAYLSILPIAALLTACGGGDGSGTSDDDLDGNAGSVVSAATANAAYTGLRTAAALDQQNSEAFMRQFFNLKVLNSVLGAPQVSALDQVTSCSNGGTILLTGTVSNGGTGSLTSTYNSCNQGVSTIDGVTYTTVNATDQNQAPSDAAVSYEGLSVQTGGRSFLMTGIETYLKQDFSETTVVNATIEEDGVQMFLENMTTNQVSYSPNAEGEGELVSGRLYLSNEGFVDITSSERLVYEWNVVGGYPIGGQMKMDGASGSNIIISPLGWAGSFQAFLDQDGDGVTDLIAKEGNQPMELVWETPELASPVAKISVYEDVVYSANSPISFFAHNSVNHGGSIDALYFEWLVVPDDMPFGATASINVSPDSDHLAEFITDTSGDYTVQLIVTDSNGYQDFATKQFTIEN